MKRLRAAAILLIAAILAALAFSPACGLIKHDPNEVNNSTGSPELTADPSTEPTPEATGEVGPAGSDTPASTDAGGQPVDSTVPAETAAPSPSDGSGATASPSGGATAAPSQTAPAVTHAPTPAPTLPPDATPTPKPDPVTSLTWFDDSAPVYCDLDFDGKAERVELDIVSAGANSYDCTLTVVLGKNGSVLKQTFSAEYFTKALVNNFNSGDNRVEIVISTGVGLRGQMIRAFRLNSGSSALVSCELPGWIETVDNNAIQVGRYIDVIGTWGCTAWFAFDNDGFGLVQQGEEWQVHRDSDRWCNVATDLIYQLIIDNSTENYAAFLYPGDRLYPVATDLTSYIRFVTDLDDNGIFNIKTNSSGTILINDTPVDDCFSNLSYMN